jgi:cytochrome c-type biogenesis protein CcmH/NrfG
MFDDRYSVPKTPGQGGRKRKISFIVGLLVVNASYFVIRPLMHGNPCTSWLSSGYDRGISLDLYGDRMAAVAAYSDDLKRNPQHAEALANRGYDYGGLGQFDLAVADLTEALKLQPHNWDVLTKRASVYLQQDKFDLAIADFTQAVQLQPDIWSNWQDRGDAYMAHGDLDAAIADYTRSLTADGKNAVDLGYYPRGIAYLRAGKFDLAKADFAAYAAAYPLSTEPARGLDCAAQRSNTGDCAIVYPTPPNPDTQRLLDAGARSLSGCQED